MKIRIPQSAPSLAVSFCALFVALGGAGYAAVSVTQNQAANAAGAAASPGLISSGGEKFLNAGETVVLGKNGHFTFRASCRTAPKGENVAVFTVVSDQLAALDGNHPMVAGNTVVINRISDALAGAPEGTFVQTSSASASTEIAADGEEADIFYNDGVNWNVVNVEKAHDCFAGYNGFLTQKQ